MKRTGTKAEITIFYCPRCGWLLRAAWMAQEILTTFAEDVRHVALAPGESGEFRVLCGETVIWDRRTDGGFPQPKELKQRVRDAAAPGRGLGHAEGRGGEER